MVEVIGSGKHSSLLWYGDNYCRKKFYSTGPRCIFGLRNYSLGSFYENRKKTEFQFSKSPKCWQAIERPRRVIYISKYQGSILRCQIFNIFCSICDYRSDSISENSFHGKKNWDFFVKGRSRVRFGSTAQFCNLNFGRNQLRWLRFWTWTIKFGNYYNNYKEFNYNINKCDITYKFLSFIGKISYK